MSAYRGEVKDKDLEQLTTVRECGIKYLLSYDKDFRDVKEYVTPKEFVGQFGVKPRRTEF
jgi:hypothetical protein